jgi:hypothetical protein
MTSAISCADDVFTQEVVAAWRPFVLYRSRQVLVLRIQSEKGPGPGTPASRAQMKSSRNRLADFYAAVAKRQQDRSRVDARVDCSNFLLREWGAAYEEIPDW